jgi:hypothetical protein
MAETQQTRADPAGDDLQATVGKIEQLAKEQSRQIRWYSDWTVKFEPIEAEADEFARRRIEEFSGKPEDLIGVIKGRREHLSLSSGITNQIVSICQQILAFGAAGLALTVGFIDKIRQFSIPVQKSLAIVGLFYSELVLLSLVVLLWYMLQARFRYPSLYFDNIGNAWPFFYYATITPVARAPIQTARQRLAASVAYAKDFANFTEKVMKEQPKERLRAELQQYFLLMSYQAYVHQFSLRLASIFVYGFTGAVCTAVIMFAALFGGLL